MLIASILYEANKHMTWAEANAVLEHACNLLQRDNPQFNRVRFYKEVALPMAFIKKTLKEQR